MYSKCNTILYNTVIKNEKLLILSSLEYLKTSVENVFLNEGEVVKKEDIKALWNVSNKPIVTINERFDVYSKNKEDEDQIHVLIEEGEQTKFRYVTNKDWGDTSSKPVMTDWEPFED